MGYKQINITDEQAEVLETLWPGLPWNKKIDKLIESTNVRTNNLKKPKDLPKDPIRFPDTIVEYATKQDLEKLKKKFSSVISEVIEDIKKIKQNKLK